MASIDTDTIIDERYRVISKIGSGGMAEVFVAQDLQLGRKVALKLLYERFAADAEFVERFRREASSAAGLQHPNVVQVYDRGQWNGTYYIAMEYLEGRALKQVIREEGPLAPARAIDITLQVLRAARFAHKRGVIHRDLKPHNVMLDSEDKVKVTDFGIALAGASDMTETGSIMGTAQYLSPEQAQGDPVSAQSDLYAIGIVLYEMLTGKVPFQADSPVSIALKHVSERPPSPRALNSNVSPGLDAIVMRALAKPPADRFTDADEFIAALEAEQRGAPAPVYAAATQIPPSRAGDTQRSYGGSVPPPPGAAYPPEPLEEERRNQWWVWALIAAAIVALAIGAFFLFLQPEKVKVPNVVGQRGDVAAQILRNREFDVNIEMASNPSVPRDRVATQSPQPNVKVKKGSTVTIVVSSGPGQGTIPFVQGETRKNAEKLLKEAGYEIDVRLQASDSVTKGTVIDTEPPQRSQLELGQTVTLFVSSGPGKVAVPDVATLTRDDAETRLAQAGLKVTVKTQESPDEDPGRVLSQDPAAGKQVDKGSTVTITVAAAPANVTVPDVRGVNVSDAVNALSEAGFLSRTRTRLVTNPNDAGVVLDQNPAGGVERKPGTRVTIIVGRLDSGGT